MKKLLAFLILVMSTSAWSMDEYDGEILKIKRVKVGNIEYSNVNITVDNVISIGNNFNLDDIDVYDPATNTLLIANVTYKDVIYRSVRVTVGKVLSVSNYDIEKTYDEVKIENEISVKSFTRENLYSFANNLTYWRMEFTGSEVGSCELIAIEYGNIRGGGLCLVSSKNFDDFWLRGNVNSADETMAGISVVLNSVNNGPIFRGVFNKDGTGSGIWEKITTGQMGTWTAQRYASSAFIESNIKTPDTSSIAAENNIYGYWTRPSQGGFPEGAFFLPNGKFAWVNLPCGGIYGSCAIGVTFGTFNTQNTNWSINYPSTLFTPITTFSKKEEINASGYFVPSDRVVGVMKSSIGSQTILSFDKYEKSNSLAITLSELKGVYYSNNYTSLIIKSDGTFSGTVADNSNGCKFNGTIKSIDKLKKFNIFEVKIKYYSKLPTPVCVNNTEFSGYMRLTNDYGKMGLHAITLPINKSLDGKSTDRGLVQISGYKVN
jgi:hypothetical protein